MLNDAELGKDTTINNALGFYEGSTAVRLTGHPLNVAQLFVLAVMVAGYCQALPDATVHAAVVKLTPLSGHQ